MEGPRYALALSLVGRLNRHLAYAAGSAWTDLDARAQEILAPLQDTWEQLPEQRACIQARQDKWNVISDEERATIRCRRAWFRSLPEERRARLNARWRSMTSAQREAARARIEEYRRASPVERAKIRREIRGSRE